MATTTTTPTPADVAAKVAKLRAAAKDTSIPQDVRNTYLDKANELERSTYKPTMAKGGMVAPKAAKAPAKKTMAKAPSVAIVIGMPKKLAKGGAVGKKGC